MKTFQINLTKVVALVCYASIGIRIVLGIPEKHRASDGREYLIETEYKYNWYEAQHKCARRGSQLVTIDSEEKNTAIVNLLKEVIGKSRNLWLGGNDEFGISLPYKDRPFFWSTTGQKFTFTYWTHGEPNFYGQQEHCVHINLYNSLYRWNDHNCNNKMGFICEDNYCVDTCNRKLKTECNTVDKFNSDVFLKFERLQKDNMNDLNTKFQTLERMAKDGKSEMEKLKNIINSAVQKLFDAVDTKFNSDVFLKFERLQKDNMNELNTRLQTLERMAKDGKSETQKLQSINESSVKKLVDQQELTVKNLWEKIQKQGNGLSEQIKQSMQQINANFDEKLNASISSPYPWWS